jgi:methyl-accepting chemotaxis protein
MCSIMFLSIFTYIYRGTGEITLKLKLSHKLISMMLILLVVPSLIIGAIGFYNAKINMDNLGKTTLKNGVEMAIQMIDAMNKEVEAGNLSLEEAQERVKVYLIGEMQSDGKRKITSPVDLGENGYFIVYDESGLEVAHPTIEGQNVWETQDVDGKFLVQEQIEAAKNGGGYTKYKWNLPNDPNRVASKITYNKQEPNWGWVVAAGTYEMDFNKAANSVLYIIVFTLGISLIIGVIVSLLFARRIAAPITMVTNQVKEVAAGNLAVDSIQVNRKDELGDMVFGFNSMVSSLRTLIGKVEASISEMNSTSQNLSAVAQETTASSEEIHRAIDEISRGASQQASDADETNRTSVELADQINTLYSKTQEMQEGSATVEDSNTKGLASVTVLKEKSLETSSSVEQVREVITTLSERVKEIEVVIGTINQISEQTNLLALNASIEAARAGEHGKGFAVVAQEVRKLAEQTSSATEQVRQTITGIIDETSKANQEMENTKSLVQDQSDAVLKTEDSFTLIAESVKGLGTLLKDVNTNIHGLMQSKDNVIRSIESIASVSQQSAASTEEISSSINEQLNAITVVSSSANELDELINELKVELSKYKID